MDITSIIAIIGALVSVLSVIVLYLKSRGENTVATLNAKTAAENSKIALDSRIDARVKEQLETAWGRIDTLEKGFKELEDREIRRTGAITRILKAIAAQWPGSSGPDLDPADIAIIEETIPQNWIRPKNK